MWLVFKCISANSPSPCFSPTNPLTFPRIWNISLNDPPPTSARWLAACEQPHRDTPLLVSLCVFSPCLRWISPVRKESWSSYALGIFPPCLRSLLKVQENLFKSSCRPAFLCLRWSLEHKGRCRPWWGTFLQRPLQRVRSKGHEGERILEEWHLKNHTTSRLSSVMFQWEEKGRWGNQLLIYVLVCQSSNVKLILLDYCVCELSEHVPEANVWSL